MPRTSKLDFPGSNPHPDPDPTIKHADLARHAHAKALLGDEIFQRVASARVLVVGAGGIGCELLKNLAMVGFGDVTIVRIRLLVLAMIRLRKLTISSLCLQIDLDTIDLSNLNRQFLFQKQHIRQPKSLVARETALAFNPHINIQAFHDNIKEPKHSLRWIASFDIVMNALDNLDARRWVNKMCVAANVPLVESGTTGFLGQVQPIQPVSTPSSYLLNAP